MKLFSSSEEFHVDSRNHGGAKYNVSSYRSHYDDAIQQLQRESPIQYLECPSISLTGNLESGTTPISALRLRKSSRDFDEDAYLSLEQLSTLLVESYGAEDGAERGLSYRRPIPTSGNLGSPELYVFCLRVCDIPPGIYHFNSIEKRLSQVRLGNFDDWLRHKVFFQPEHARGSAVLILTSDFGRLRMKYGERGYRLALLDAGHLSQTIYLLCAAMEIKVCATAGFVDRELDDGLQIDGLRHASVLAITIGL